MRIEPVLTWISLKEILRKKDVYVLLIFLVILLGFLCYQSFFGIAGISRYLRDIGYSFVMLFSFITSVTFSARQLPAESSMNTIYPLLAKPVTRQGIVNGKFTGAVVISVLSFTVFYAIYLLFSISRPNAPGMPLFLQGYLLGCMFLVMVSAIVIFFSTFLTLGANVTISFVLYAGIGPLSDIIKNEALKGHGMSQVISSLIYYIIPHLEYYDFRIRIAHGWDALPPWVILAVAGYTAAYSLSLIYSAGLIFRRKRF